MSVHLDIYLVLLILDTTTQKNPLHHNEYSRIFNNILLDEWNTLEYFTVSLEYSNIEF